MNTENNIVRLTPDELWEKIKSDDLIVLDVRTPGEFEGRRIESSFNIPLSEVSALDDLAVNATQDIVLVCESGRRAEEAYNKMVSSGFSNVSILEGGMQGWVAAGLPVKQLKQKWELERQVRLAAGFLVLLGVLTGIKLPKMRFLSGFVGGGLIFAAVSNTCMMGKLLMKLPYNSGRVADTDKVRSQLQDSNVGCCGQK